MKRTKRSILSLLVTLCVTLSLLPALTPTANAADYLDADGSSKSASATSVTASDTGWGAGWYVVDSDVTNANRITVTGAAVVTDVANNTAYKYAKIPFSATPPAYSLSYTLTIPATLDIANAGWNSIGNIEVDCTTNDFDIGKQVKVTAASANNWKLKSTENNTVSYTLKNAESDTSATTSWTFTAEQLNGDSAVKQAIGIDVEDYSAKPAGAYKDTVTFTAKVEDAA